MYLNKWTKPIKNRKFKILGDFLNRKIWSIRYLIYKLLSKYNIIYKECNYTDSSESGDTYQLPFNDYIEVNNICGNLVSTIREVTYTHNHYFYKIKKGVKVNVFNVLSDFHTQQEVYSRLVNVGLIVNGHTYFANFDLHKITIVRPKLVETIPHNENSSRRVESEYCLVDVSKITNLRSKRVLNSNFDIKATVELQCIYHLAKEDFIQKLEETSFNDLLKTKESEVK